MQIQMRDICEPIKRQFPDWEDIGSQLITELVLTKIVFSLSYVTFSQRGSSIHKKYDRRRPQRAKISNPNFVVMLDAQKALFSIRIVIEQSGKAEKSTAAANERKN